METTSSSTTRKVVLLAFVFALTLASIFAFTLTASAEAGYSGSCGENVTYVFHSDTGELVISGTGAMHNYSISTETPWQSFSSSIDTVTIQNGVTSIGLRAFYGCDKLVNITIPNSVTAIENYAFRNCISLTNITIPNSVTSIGSYAFCNCSSLTSITIPDSVTSIGGSAFSNCTSLTSITIPDSVTSIGIKAFKGCNSLHHINYCGDPDDYFPMAVGNGSLNIPTQCSVRFHAFTEKNTDPAYLLTEEGFFSPETY